MKTGLITIGNEILSGKTVNTNLAWIGSELMRIGLRVHRSMTIMDKPEDIRSALEEMVGECDLVLTTGGLGPTKDDITKQVIADFFKKPMTFSEEVWRQVKERFEARQIKMPEINRNQAELPADFVALRNPYGTAPGLFYEADGKMFVAMPGVPHEMKKIMQDHVLPLLAKRFPGGQYHIESIHTSGIAESRIAELTDHLVLPEETELAYLPQMGRVSLRVTGKNADRVAEVKAELEAILQEWIWGYGDETPAERAHELFVRQGIQVAFAESCTGGLIQKLLSDFPGSSHYLVGGVVAYSNEVKESILGVSHETLEKYGAVSQETAIEMVDGAHRVFGVEYAGAVTGIAGPDGGTSEKPVGLVYISVYCNGKVYTDRLQLIGPREVVRKIAAEKLLLLLMKHITIREV